MRNKLLFIQVLIMVISVTAKSQTQSTQLPIPSENASVINFTNPANPNLVALPTNSFINTDLNLPGLPHDEYDLEFASPSIYEAYVGQHPMYGQTVVNDADGNLLFFIVDNNIYNRYGVAMIDV